MELDRSSARPGGVQRFIVVDRVGMLSRATCSLPSFLPPRCRNWCAYVVSRSVSCVVEDGVDTYVKPDYQPCVWGQLHCPRVVT